MSELLYCYYWGSCTHTSTSWRCDVMPFRLLYFSSLWAFCYSSQCTYCVRQMIFFFTFESCSAFRLWPTNHVHTLVLNTCFAITITQPNQKANQNQQNLIWNEYMLGIVSFLTFPFFIYLIFRWVSRKVVDSLSVLYFMSECQSSPLPPPLPQFATVVIYSQRKGSSIKIVNWN